MDVRILSRVQHHFPVWYIPILAFSTIILFAVGFDQGQIINTVAGQTATQLTWLHEFFHDARHVAGFPCH